MFEFCVFVLCFFVFTCSILGCTVVASRDIVFIRSMLSQSNLVVILSESVKDEKVCHTLRMCILNWIVICVISQSFKKPPFKP